MNTVTVGTDWLSRLPVAGRLSPSEIAAKLREIGEDEDEDEDSLAPAAAPGSAAYGSLPRFGTGRDRAWLHTAHTIGYLPPVSNPGSRVLPIRHAANIAADQTLKGASVKLTLDGLRAADYPGRGTHHILFDFAARNQTDQGPEQLHFNMARRVVDGEQAGVLGRPIFTGVHVGAEGLFLQFVTVNVLNEGDEVLLQFLGSDAFQGGLKLLGTIQPALIPFSAMACGITEMIAKRHRNLVVQAVDLGLDFSRIAPRPRLAEGSYVAVQIPETQRAVWQWQEWGFDPLNGRIVNVNDRSLLIPYNYVTISVSRCP
jgi:hypothetical protein